MEKRELEFSTRLTREDVAGLIEALIEGLKDGCLKVQKSDDVLELDVPKVVDLKIEAEIDDERAEFEIEVSWLTNRAGSPDTVPDESPVLPVAEGKDTAGSAARKASPRKRASVAKAGAKVVPAGQKKAPAKRTAGKAPVAKQGTKPGKE